MPVKFHRLKPNRQNTTQLLITFRTPIFVLISIICSIFLQHVLQIGWITTAILITAIIVGSLQLIRDTTAALKKGRLALDYIAILAISVGLLTQQYLVAAVIVLMLSGGNTLEEYGMTHAKQSLTGLIDRIPKEVHLWKNGRIAEKMFIEQIEVGSEIAVRKGEVIPLDGTLCSPAAITDESSLTGEPYMLDKIQGDQIRSGTINLGNIIVLRVTRKDEDSTYRKIIEMVKKAQLEKAPLIRLADKYSAVFTIITLVLAVIAYLISYDFHRVLAVLVIATPCPLILATPIALMGGMSAAAKKRIILKRLSSLEIVSRVKTIIFDKTGTITMGKPIIDEISIHDQDITKFKIFSIAAAIERNSLHPLAKAIVDHAKHLKAPVLHAEQIHEELGQGISGIVEGKNYTLSKSLSHGGMAISLVQDNKPIATFQFIDKLKPNSKKFIKRLKKWGLHILIFTGDKKEKTDEIVAQIGTVVDVKTDCTPEDKKKGIELLKKQGLITAMVGDGINDAPALAYADVGMVFSNEEQTAASEAADIIFLGGDFVAVTDILTIARGTIQIAIQSIVFGIGISTLGMVAAALGYIPPYVGAFIQEAIDIFVIFNALRSSRL